MIFGVVTGLGAAFFQALVYLATRQYVQTRAGRGSRELLVLAHVWMGLFSLLVLPLVWRGDLGAIIASVWLPLLLCTAFYISAQICLVLALKHAEASRVSPLLGFKIVVLAVLATFFVLPHGAGNAAAAARGLTWLQWSAVFMCVAGAITLNFSGVRLRRRAILAVVAACVCYSLADWNITLTVLGVAPRVGSGLAPVLTTVLVYGICGIIALAFLPRLGTRDPKAWRDAVPFAIFWFLAMLFLFACFAALGPVLGSILQSTRGLMSIVMGSLLMHRGHFHLEPLSTKSALARRFAAGALMFLAVSLYVIKDPQRLMMSHEHSSNPRVSHGTANASVHER